MEPTEALDRTTEPVVVSGVAPADSGFLEDLKSLWHELRGLVHDQLTLAALETRLAGNSLVTMIAAGVMVAALLVTQRPRAARSKLFEKALKLIVLARILMKAFPSTGMDPSAHSGLPGQSPAPRYRSAAA